MMTDLDPNAIYLGDELVDTRNGYINPAIYTDESIYQRELEQVFGRSWLFLAHDSQLPKAGSFVQTYMGEDPVLVVRQRDGSVKAFLNQCRHRGMRICRSDEGTSRTFTCTYHGWAYDLEGNLINVPMEDRAYRGEIDKSAWGARKVPRITNYKGFHFGTWSDEAPEFTEYLGEMAYYVDAVVDRWDNGLEFVSGTTKWVIDTNWKFAAEQFSGDNYHVPVSHASSVIALTDQPMARLDPSAVLGRSFSGNGHGSAGFWLPEFGAADAASMGPAYDGWLRSRKEEVFRRIGEERALKVNAANTIFPNFSWLGQSATMRVWHPRGPGQIEVWAWTYVPRDAPEQVKADIRRGTQRTFSPAGAFETDDGENWTEVQQVLRGHEARKTRFSLQMGLGHEERDTHGLPGRSDDTFTEMPARGFYQHWSDLMTGLSWADIAELDPGPARRRADDPAGGTSMSAPTGPAPYRGSAPAFRTVDVVTQHTVEQFVFAEAQLLDEHRYVEWIELFAEDVHYWAPTRTTRTHRERDQEIATEDQASYIDDDLYYLTGRVRRLTSGIAWSEEPPSRTRRLITNIRVTEEAGELHVTSNFYVYRSRLERHQDWFVGERFDVLRPADTEATGYPFVIADRRIVLDQTTLLAPSLSVLL